MSQQRSIIPVLHAPQACRRCHARKRKCDRVYPTCGACSEARAECAVELDESDHAWLSQVHEYLRRTEDLRQRIQWLETYIRGRQEELADIANLPTGTDLGLIQSNGPPELSPATLLGSFVPNNLPASPTSSASQHPDLPNLDGALTYVRGFLSSPSQSQHSIDLAEVEADVRSVYGANGLIDPNLAASRFRCFSAIYIEDARQRAAEIGSSGAELGPTCRHLALRELSVLTKSEDLTAVQALSLLSLYTLYEPGGISLSQIVGFAARTAFAINLHRRDDVYLPPLLPTLSAEADVQLHNRKRKDVFWAVYCLDRLAQFTIGHPCSIRDVDIDIELPDLPHSLYGRRREVSDVAILRHNINLRKLYGEIQEHLYSITANPNRPLQERRDQVSKLMTSIQSWYDQSPFRSAFLPMSDVTISRQATDDISYHQMIIALHRPSPLIPTVPTDFVVTLNESSRTAVELYQHYWPRKQVAVIWIHLYHIFSSCTALIFTFCEYETRQELIAFRREEIEAQIAQCNDLLDRFGSTWPESQRYRTIFAALVQSYHAQAVQASTIPYHDITMPESISEWAQPPDSLSALVDMLRPASDSTGLFQTSEAFSTDTISPSSMMRGFWTSN